MASICLNMIVRNESRVIKRCVGSVRNLIDYWVICDTGSTDGTQDIIRRTLADIPGELHERPWLDFGHNRNETLQRSAGKADYHLLLDADMTVHVHAPFKDNLTADSYLLRYDGPVDYYQTLLVSDQHRWKYVGVTHEYITSPTARFTEKLPQLTLRHHADGGTRLEKTARDIALLTQGLRDEPDNARYIFYLAQSYRDAGRADAAVQWYRLRAEAGGWEEEVWTSLYQIALLKQQMKNDWPTVLESLLSAYQYRPSRAEPLYQIARHYRQTRDYHAAHLFAKQGVSLPYPDDILFIDRAVYEYLLPMEYAICCYWVGNHAEAIRVNDAILARRDVPAHVAAQVRRNREFSLHHTTRSAHSPARCSSSNPDASSMSPEVSAGKGARNNDEPENEQYDFTHWGRLPKVSCQCITYGRTTLLDEAVESFLRQDYPGEKELVILNDYPELELRFDHPQVRVVNLPYRMRSIGEKRNACVALCTGEVIFPWDDDDISLPHRISYSLQQMKDRRYFKAHALWSWNAGKIHSDPWEVMGHAMSCWHATLFDEVGGYPHIQSGEDWGLEERFNGRRTIEETPTERLYYVYRQDGTNSYHASTYGYGNGYREAAVWVANHKIEGIYQIRPHWAQDYCQLVHEAVGRNGIADLRWAAQRVGSSCESRASSVTGNPVQPAQHRRDQKSRLHRHSALHVNPRDSKQRVELIGPVHAPGQNGPTNGMYALQKALRRRIDEGVEWLAIRSLPADQSALAWFWRWEDRRYAIARETEGQPFVQGPNMLFANSSKPRIDDVECSLLDAANCRAMFCHSLWYRDLIAAHRGPGNQSPIVLWPYPVDPWPSEPLPDKYDVLIYAKNGKQPQLLEHLAELFPRHIQIHYGRYKREELFDAARRSRACTYLADDDHGPLALQEILLAGCPTVGVRTGASLVQPGVTGFVIERMPSGRRYIATPDDEAALSTYLEYLLQAQSMDRRNVRAAAVESFDTHGIVRRVIDALENARTISNS